MRRTPIGSLPSRTPNTFRTSVLRSWRTTLMSVMRTLAPLGERAQRHGDDDQASPDDVLVEVRHAEQVEPVRDQAEHHDPEHGPPHGADAEDARPAERDPRDRGERDGLARRVARRALRESRVVEEPRDPGREAGDDERRDHDPVDLEPGQPRRVAIPAGPVDVSAEDGPSEDDL